MNHQVLQNFRKNKYKIDSGHVQWKKVNLRFTTFNCKQNWHTDWRELDKTTLDRRIQNYKTNECVFSW